MTVDFNRAAMLLHIVEETRQYPNMKAIHDLAMFELGTINDVALEDYAKVQEDAKNKKAEAEAQAVEEAQAKREADRQEETKHMAQQQRPVAAQNFTEPKLIPGATPADQPVERKI